MLVSNKIPNTDEDIYGCLVFRSASGKDEYTRLTDLPVRQAPYTDTLPGQDLNRSDFYKIVALDQRQHQQNQPAACPPLELVKTDRQAPSAPLMGQVRSPESGLEINWLHSSSAVLISFKPCRDSNKLRFAMKLSKFNRQRFI